MSFASSSYPNAKRWCMPHTHGKEFIMSILPENKELQRFLIHLVVMYTDLSQPHVALIQPYVVLMQLDVVPTTK